MKYFMAENIRPDMPFCKEKTHAFPGSRCRNFADTVGEIQGLTMYSCRRQNSGRYHREKHRPSWRWRGRDGPLARPRAYAACENGKSKKTVDVPRAFD
jgi:hypothetical protein